MYRNSRLALILVLVNVFAGPALADTDLSLSQVYEAARAGHLDRAQQMMSEVLRDHPKSAKAHYVRAELYAEQRNSAMGRRELAIAQELDPSLSFATPESVSALKGKLSRAQSMQARPVDVQPRSTFPWGLLVIGAVGAGVLLWVFLRGRREPSNVYSQVSEPSNNSQVPAAAPVAGAPMAPGRAGVAPPVAAGSSGGVVGGLASGFAAGAGIVAGEELAHHFLDSGRREDVTPVASNSAIISHDDDLGGQDFGVSDGNSWDNDTQAPDGDDTDDDWT
jgi:hypothetical protein